MIVYFAGRIRIFIIYLGWVVVWLVPLVALARFVCSVGLAGFDVGIAGFGLVDIVGLADIVGLVAGDTGFAAMFVLDFLIVDFDLYSMFDCSDY